MKRKNPAYVEQALRGHRRAQRDGAEAQDDPNDRPGHNQAGACDPNTSFQGTDHYHDDVKTAKGSTGPKHSLQARNSYGPNIKLHGVDHRHDAVKSDTKDRPGGEPARKAPKGQAPGWRGSGTASA